MKREILYDAITGIREDLICRAEAYHAKKRTFRWQGAVAAVLAAAVIGGAMLRPEGNPMIPSAYAIAQAQYPEMAPYPMESDYTTPTGGFDDPGFSAAYDAWREDLLAQRRPEGYADGLEAFFAAGSREFLTGEAPANRVYSPLNVYMALGMLAELTDGDSRAQILAALGSGSIDALRAQATDLWNANYRRDGAVSQVLASSLWLNEEVEFRQDTMDTLAEIYYASSYQGEMGSEGLNQALQEWLNQQTGGLLEEQAAAMELSPDTLLALATTVFFQAKWSREFSPEGTTEEIFHTAEGDVTCPFMHQSRDKTYYWADSFSAVSQSLENGGAMWFLLPDEGLSPEALLDDPQTMEFILAGGEWDGQKRMMVNQSIPKFDVVSQLDLRSGLQALGITEVFDPACADFTPTTPHPDGMYLSRAKHDARVVIDEVGCTAAAYTVMEAPGAAPPPEEEVDFVLDRPFLFAITTRDGLPLFVGIVHQPV